MPEDFNARVIREFRENDGKVGPPFEGAPMILLHHVGAKSGAERVTPLIYFPEPDHYVIATSAAGAPSHPAWYHNLKTTPDVTVELATDSGVDTFTAHAEEITGDERDAQWDKIVGLNPGFGDYARKTEGIRTIPLIALTRAA
jgi:deazaflavin-dependent oxidoreductase (nitroreductase family)